MKNRRVKTIRVSVFLLLMSIISMAYAHTVAENRGLNYHTMFKRFSQTAVGKIGK